jgi:hypothetical protein
VQETDPGTGQATDLRTEVNALGKTWHVDVRFDRDKLDDLARTLSGRYATATPFPHAVIDEFLPEGVLDAVVAEFPSTEEESWWRFNSEKERKLGSTDASSMGATTRQLFSEFNGPVFVDFLGELTGITGLVPDPHLFGGGLHQIETGGYLEIHADFNRHPLTGLERRINVLLYLNRNWDERWGGALELWSTDMSGPQQTLFPIFNRCVVFSTTDTSFHGHPHPLACPPGITRKSLALYYYSLPPDQGGEAGHNTVFPRFALEEQPSSVKRWTKELVPPLAVRGGRRLRQWGRRGGSDGGLYG